MRKISIGYFADGVWGLNSLKKILKQNKINIKFVCLRYRTPDKKILNFCKKKRIKVENFAKVNSLSSKKKILNYKCDYLVSMSYDQIFGSFLVDKFKNKIINCHAGNLPFYRGRNVLNWVLINGEKFFGITVHYIDKSIDTGDIIVQKKYPINSKDNYKTLLNKCFKECPILLNKALKKINNNTISPVKQSSIDKKGSYFRRRIDGDENIDWSLNSMKILNFIRGISKPGPIARSKVGDNQVYINKAHRHSYYSKKNYKPGTIISFFKKYPIVSTIDGSIRLKNFYSKKKLQILDNLQ